MWLQLVPIEDKIVVSEIGEQWSPKIAPVNTPLVHTIVNDMSPELTAQANGIAKGINILMVPYAVPVAKEIKAPKIKINVGTMNCGNVFLRTPTK